ncbi:Phenylpropionate dioxygenase, large terminal subunit [Enhydrobacter aerosaccus]|uniref:Phenylpropionate dioxygenase, large terminal subunit n=1 Tax=Enhydrobacter aerosaccus TaxID=225324 RepID=A0A1T4SZK8_9HYPH|nr:Rieske 2Fe-2S domain-containing protein [Enhydrobacter aerosaccus]SKA33673.1 Phenylpropionate dioxygenase, large terminal subunit [Enhydrobacter aerosaccus]
MDTITTVDPAAARLDGSYYQTWYPVCLAGEVLAGTLLGVDILDTRVIVYRDDTGRAVVQSAWCPHLGADLSQGTLVEGQVRCPYHHWRFDRGGACSHIPTGDRIPSAARIVTYPTAEAWGFIWLFNGTTAMFDPPRMPDATEADLDWAAHFRGIRSGPGEAALSNGVDFQHLRTLHGLNTTEPDEITVRDHEIEFRVEAAGYSQHGIISGMSTFAQHLTPAGRDLFMLFCGAPIDRTRRRSFFTVGIPRRVDRQDGGQDESQALENLGVFVERLLSEDEPILERMRLRRGTLVASDRHLARYFRYAKEFPRAVPPGI